MDLDVLQEIGLTTAEIKVYTSLLELGSVSAGKVVELSGLHNAVVHRTFHSLIQKGLVTYVLVGKAKQYQAIDPKYLLDILSQKQKRIEKLIPHLEAKKNSAISKPQATIFQGKKGVKELLHMMLDTSSKEYLSYGGPKAAHELFGDFFWESFHKKRIARKINAKLLFHSSLKKWAKELNGFKHTTVKTIEMNFEEITETIICGNRTAIVVYTKEPFGFLIESSAAVTSYKKFFSVLWKGS